MRRQALLALIVTVMTVSVLPAQAQATNHHHALTLAQGKRAITHFVSKVGASIEGIQGEQVSQCEKHQGGVICEGLWVTAEQKCSVWLGALPTRPIIVKELGKLTCAERNNEEFDLAPSSNS